MPIRKLAETLACKSRSADQLWTARMIWATPGGMMHVRLDNERQQAGLPQDANRLSCSRTCGRSNVQPAWGP